MLAFCGLDPEVVHDARKREPHLGLEMRFRPVMDPAVEESYAAALRR